jgi:hypothetical protein
MQLSVNDYIGFIGVFILLIAFLFNLIGKMDKDGLAYIVLNVLGAGLSCFASYLIHYLPFVILEGTWALVSAVALVKYVFKKNAQAN